MTYVSNLLSLLLYLLVYGNVMSDDRDTFFVTEGDSVTLQYYMRETQDQDIRIIHDKGYSIDSCTFTDHLTCRFDHKGLRDRLKVYENGSLTITNTKVTDSGDYDITTFYQSHVRHRTRSYSVVVRGFFSFDTDRVSVMEGDSVTLHIGDQVNQEQKIRWYFNQTEIARILEYDPFHHSRICTDVQCNNDTERFRNRLKLDHQTGSLTITDITNTDSGFYDLLINSVWDNHHFRYSSRSSSNTKIFIVAVHDVPAAERHKMKRKSVKEGESVTLDTRVKKYPRHLITWYFNDIIIAVINGVQSKICTDERFRDRLKLDHQTGSLTIKNSRTTDSGFYKLQIRSSRFTIMRSFSVSASSYSVDSGKVSVMEGDLVTLHTAVETNQQEEIRWRFNDMLIAGITGDLSFICTDVQCNNPAERFRDRLKLNHQTGSLTIRDITITDSGDYTLEINSSSSIQRNVSFSVTGVSAAERDEMKRKSVKEGESVTLDTHVINKPDNLMWHFDEIVITGDQSNICTDVQCEYSEERFRDRLKLDNQTGSLTITNTRTTDSGLYKLQITSYSTIRVTSEKSFSVTVIGNVMSDDRDTFFVTEGDSFTLKYYMREELWDIWMYHDGERYSIRYCRHHNWCISDYEGFGDRLEGNQNGPLTITNTKVTDSGDYRIETRFGNRILYSSTVVVRGFFSFDTNGVSVMEGDSVTLHTGVLLNQEEKISDQIIPTKKISAQIKVTAKIRWYFNKSAIVRILGDLSYICTDVLCNKGNERFRDRLKLDHQTGSLTIRDIRTTDSGLYDLLINWDNNHSSSSSSSKRRIESWQRRSRMWRRTSNTKIFIVAVHGVSDAERHEMKRKSVKEGESVTLDTRVIKNPHNSITWYFNDIGIAVITRDQSEICSVDRYRDRLKLDHQTGSLTITNITNTDSGLYKLQIRSSRFTIMRSFIVSAVSYSVDSGKVSVKEGYSVTLHTDVETNQQEEIRWRFNDILIAEISGDLSFICTDVQCNNEGTERFRDRLKLDHQTGSLTIRDIRTTDSGDYTLQIINNSSIKRDVSVTVTGVSAAERDEMKRKSVKEGESVTLDTYVINKPDIMWHFNETVITRDQCKICTDVQCKERFRDRVKLDNQTGSLTIVNTRITDSGLYKLQITSYSTIGVTSEKSFSVTVIADRTGIYSAVSAVLVFLVASAGLIYSCKCNSRRQYIRTQRSHQANGVEDSSSNQAESVVTNTPHESSFNLTEFKAASETLT
uniref:Ig-like domain-containing protein n=1 Tax=Cyprinus carpio TaxID=7962 RepID=A0A8C1YWW7_CYPCA